MYKALTPWAISVNAPTIESLIAAAKVGGFQGIELGIKDVADRIDAEGLDAVKALFADSGIRAAGWGLPTDWRGDERAFQRDLAALPRLAAAGQAIGCTRTFTWVPAGSNDRDFADNYKFHVERFKAVANVLADYDCRFGLEYIGPKTYRETFRYQFVHTLPAMLELGHEAGPNVGLLCDCWHWHTSHETTETIRNIRAQDVVYVHVNDAPAGINTDEQVDGTRALPGETGVIDIAGFLQALDAIGYDGPIVPEPFKKELADLPSDEARLKLVGGGMDAIFATAGITPA